MKVYIAGRYKSREQLCELAERMEREGIEVTSSWLKGMHEWSEDDRYPEVMRATFAKEDLYDIDRADCFLLVRGNGPMEKGGLMVELGYALAKKKTILLVGFPKNVFEYLPEVHRFLGTAEEEKRLVDYLAGVYYQ